MSFVVLPLRSVQSLTPVKDRFIDEFIQALKVRGYNAISTRYLGAALENSRFGQLEACTTSICMSKLSQLVGTRFLIHGSLTSDSAEHVIELHVVDVPNSKEIALHKETFIGDLNSLDLLTPDFTDRILKVILASVSKGTVQIGIKDSDLLSVDTAVQILDTNSRDVSSEELVKYSIMEADDNAIITEPISELKNEDGSSVDEISGGDTLTSQQLVNVTGFTGNSLVTSESADTSASLNENPNDAGDMITTAIEHDVSIIELTATSEINNDKSIEGISDTISTLQNQSLRTTRAAISITTIADSAFEIESDSLSNSDAYEKSNRERVIVANVSNEKSMSDTLESNTAQPSGIVHNNLKLDSVVSSVDIEKDDTIKSNTQPDKAPSDILKGNRSKLKILKKPSQRFFRNVRLSGFGAASIAGIVGCIATDNSVQKSLDKEKLLYNMYMSVDVYNTNRTYQMYLQQTEKTDNYVQKRSFFYILTGVSLAGLSITYLF